MDQRDPVRIAQAAKPGHHVVGRKLDRTEREDLLQRLPPRYARAIADHVTLKAKVAASTPAPVDAPAAIIGRADDGAGVEAMVAEIAGSTRRPGGGIFHITWSLAAGRSAQESNDVLEARGWTQLAEPIPITLHPGTWQ